MSQKKDWSAVFYDCPGALYGNLPDNISVSLVCLDDARQFLLEHGLAIRDVQQAPYDRRTGVLLVLRRIWKT